MRDEQGRPGWIPSCRPWVGLGKAGPAAAAMALVAVLLTGAGAPWPKEGDGEPVVHLHHIHGMAVDPEDPRVLYVATHSGLVRVTDGRLWTYVGDDRSDFMGFTIHPGGKGVIFVSGHPDLRSGRPNPMGVLVSRDGGRTWKPLALEAAADMHAMTFAAPENALYGWNVMGREPGLYRIDLGDGRPRRLEGRGLQQVLALGAHPRQRGRLLAGTPQGMLGSADGGATWQPTPGDLSRIPVTALAYHPTEPSRIYAYGVTEGLGFVRSTDGGKVWKATGFLLPAKDGVVVIAPSPHAAGIVFVATAGGDVLRSGDGGAKWVPLARAGRPLTNR